MMKRFQAVSVVLIVGGGFALLRMPVVLGESPAAGEPRESAASFETAKSFWSFQPPQSHPRPAVRRSTWPLRTIDYFTLAKLEEHGLAPNDAADRRTWLRRVTFDLIGVPPTPDEIAVFLDDDAPDSHEKVVDRLLASPKYGERWARMWLDVARYAEDQAHIVGKDESLFYPNAYLYRDWVVRALNEDMPYDRFIKLQLAADLIEPNEIGEQPALGFLGLGPKYYSRNSLAVMADEWEDRVDTVARGLLGLTVACARCHDHKYDPIATQDYYALAGVFASTKMQNRPLSGGCETNADGQAKQPKDAMHVVAEGKATDLTVFVRGNVENKGPVVARGYLRVLSDSEPVRFQDGSGRRELAELIASDQNPLTARVIVNRVWSMHFGQAIVGSPSNFGLRGERPTHPELLDDLAVQFMKAGWSLKWLHRELVLSATYGQHSVASADSIARDPENRLLGRMSRRRLSVESWRDAILAVTGRLDFGLGGPSMADPSDPSETRRTVYSRVSRLQLNRVLSLFDCPDPNIHADRRVETTTPLQKMFILNSRFMTAHADSLAERIRRDVPGDRPDADWVRIERAYELLYGRQPTEAEMWLGLRFLKRSDSADAWPEYAQALLAANEMLFVD